MLTIQQVREMKTDKVLYASRVEISFRDLKTRVTERIKTKLIEVSLEEEDFKNIAETVITNYIIEKQPFVEGYVKDGMILKNNLIRDLINEITSWGKLTIFKDNPKMRELQINGQFIFVDVENGYELLRDPLTKEVIKFDNPEEAMNFIQSRLLFSSSRMTEEEPIVNAMTEEGYRIACTHPCINPAHPDEPTLKWPVAVIRKMGGGGFDETRLTTNGTACLEMLEWTSLTYEALFGNVIGGTTGCGKSTIQEFGIRHMRNQDRAGFIQDPTEIHYRNMVNGIMLNNAFYWEVDSDANPNSSRSATYNNLVNETLRMTVDMDVLGEMKDTENFVSGIRCMNMGTKVSTTMHTFHIPGILDRFALELVTGMNMTLDVAREMVCNYLGALTLCDRLGDGSRKIMGCAEILGYDKTTNEYQLNYLYEFVLVNTVRREGVEGELGMVWNVGYFVKRGTPSRATKQKMMKKIPKDKIDKLYEVPVGTVLQEYNYDKLPKDYKVKYDSYEIPLSNTTRGVIMREPEDDIGIQIGG